MDDGIRPIDENGASELVFERVELGEERDLEERPLKSKVINAGVLVVAALISLLLLANIASSPSTYSGMYETLDEKKLNVMGLAATTTAASAAISVLPDDTGSAIANKLADFASYFVVILSVIYLEKFLWVPGVRDTDTDGMRAFCHSRFLETRHFDKSEPSATGHEAHGVRFGAGAGGASECLAHGQHRQDLR